MARTRTLRAASVQPLQYCSFALSHRAVQYEMLLNDVAVAMNLFWIVSSQPEWRSTCFKMLFQLLEYY